MNQWQKATCESESCCVKQLFHHGPAWRAQENKDGVPSFADFQFAVQIKSAQKGVWLAFNKTCIMLIFLKQWWPPAALSFPSKLHGRFYLERMGKWWLQHAAWHKKEAKLHIIMFNTTFQWAISSFWNSGMVFFSLQVLRYYHGILSYQFSGWQRWNGLLGRELPPHVVSSEWPRSVWKHNYPPRPAFALDLSAASAFFFTFHFANILETLGLNVLLMFWNNSNI